MPKPSIKILYSKRRSNQGLTLIELLIAAGIVAGLTTIAVSMIFSVQKNQNHLGVVSRLKTSTEMALYRLGRELAQAIKVFDETGVGVAYRDKLDLSGAPQTMDVDDSTTYTLSPAATGQIRLPTIRDQGVQSPGITCAIDDENYFWPAAVGNSLFFAELVEVVSFPGITTPNKKRTINVYRFNYYYISEPAADSSQPFIDFWRGPSQRKAQRLIEWRSIKFADYDQIFEYFNDTDLNNVAGNFLTPSEETIVINTLASRGVTNAWDRDFNATSGTYHQAFHTINAGATFTAKSNTYLIQRASFEDALRLETRSSQAIYSIAYNRKTSPSSDSFYFPIEESVPYFYNSNPTPNCSGVVPAPQPATGSLPTGNTFPRGFEVVITGPSTGRSVLVRVTTVAKSQSNRLVEQSRMKIFFAKDL